MPEEAAATQGTTEVATPGEKEATILEEASTEAAPPEASTPEEGDASTEPKDGTVLQEAEKESQDKSSTAPESYEDFTVPEGQALDSDIIDKFKGLAKEGDLSQEKAQGFINLQMEIDAKRQEASEKLLADTQAEWKKELTGDPNYKENAIIALDALKQMPESFQKLVSEDMSFLGDNPAFMAGLTWIGNLTKEDNAITSKSAPQAQDEWPGLTTMRQKYEGSF